MISFDANELQLMYSIAYLADINTLSDIEIKY